MIKQNNGNIMIAVLAVGLLIGVGAWFVITGRDVVPSESTPTVTPNPTPEIQELTSNVDTSDWIESSYGIERPFTFKYPPTWEEILVAGGYNYKPINDESFTFWGRDPGGGPAEFTDSVNQLLQAANRSEIITNRQYVTKDGRELQFVITKKDEHGTPVINYYGYVARVPSIYSNEVGVLAFLATDYGETEVLHEDNFLNILSTFEVLED